MKPLVSILIPVYNAERWVAQAIESALGQTWPFTEIIVVDDGSTDNSLSIIRQYEKHGVKIVSQRNLGASSCRNRALEHAAGDFIQYLDADDALSLDKVERAVEILIEGGPDKVAISDIVYFWDGDDPYSGTSHGSWPRVDTDNPLEWYIDLLGPYGSGGMVQTGQWLIPKKVANDAGPWNDALSLDDDGEYFCRVVLRSKGLRQVPNGRYFYRKHHGGQSLGDGQSEKDHLSALNSLRLKKEHLLRETDVPEAKRALAKAYVTRAFVAYPSYPTITKTALDHCRALGGSEKLLRTGSWKSEIIRYTLGWRLARRLSLWLHRLNSSDP
jgi:glycosyltransferase involved in cell wall biosynthesis